ncbi:MAG: tripartite tricarboxylate transporter substrate binding protein [Pseudomonadota bacterium]
MKTLRQIGCVFLGLAALAFNPAYSQTWPTAKPISMIVPAGAGGVTDGVARVIAQWLTERLGQSVVVDNRAGAGGMLGVSVASKAKADGYTLMIGTNTTMAANVHLFKNHPVDPLKDFVPLALVVDTPFVLLVPANSPYKRVGDLVAAAKASPGKLNYGSGTSSALLCTELFKSIAGIDLVKVPYKASPQALTDIMGGQLDVLCEPLASSQGNMTTGRVRALALTGAKRSGLAPDLETVTEAGFPGMDYTAWIGFWAPAGLPKDIATRLSDEILASLKDPEVQKKMRSLGSDPRPTGPEAFAALQRAEMTKVGNVVKAARIVAE